MGFSGNKGGQAEMSESWHMQRESTGKHTSRALGKTTVIIIYPNQKKKKEGKERKRRKRKTWKRGEIGGGESRGGKRVWKCSVWLPGLQGAPHTWECGHVHSLVHKGQSPLLFYVISAFLHVSSLFWFCSKYCSIYSPVAHGLKWPSTLNPQPLMPYSLSLLKTL